MLFELAFALVMLSNSSMELNASFSDDVLITSQFSSGYISTPGVLAMVTKGAELYVDAGSVYAFGETVSITGYVERTVLMFGKVCTFRGFAKEIRAYCQYSTVNADAEKAEVLGKAGVVKGHYKELEVSPQIEVDAEAEKLKVVEEEEETEVKEERGPRLDIGAEISLIISALFLAWIIKKPKTELKYIAYGLAGMASIIPAFALVFVSLRLFLAFSALWIASLALATPAFLPSLGKALLEKLEQKGDWWIYALTGYAAWKLWGFIPVLKYFQIFGTIFGFGVLSELFSSLFRVTRRS